MKAESTLFGSELYQELFSLFRNIKSLRVTCESNTSYLYRSAFVTVPFTGALQKGTQDYFAQAFTS